MAYTAPVEQISFILNNIVGFPELANSERFADATSETAEAILSKPARWPPMCWRR